MYFNLLYPKHHFNMESSRHFSSFFFSYEVFKLWYIFYTDSIAVWTDHISSAPIIVPRAALNLSWCFCLTGFLRTRDTMSCTEKIQLLFLIFLKNNQVGSMSPNTQTLGSSVLTEVDGYTCADNGHERGGQRGNTVILEYCLLNRAASSTKQEVGFN